MTTPLDVLQLRAEALQSLTLLGTDLRRDIWTQQHQQFLEQMATDLAGLLNKLRNENDPEKQARYRRSLELIGNHVAVMAYSRLNVMEQTVQGTVLALLQKVAKLAIDVLLAKLGLATG
ncbi:MAG: hypothetical protein ABW321_04950 [Polyangiales bacterium]